MQQKVSTNGTLRVIVISSIIFFALLFSLSIGWVILRCVLVPPLGGELPPSGARPWSRTLSDDTLENTDPAIAMRNLNARRRLSEDLQDGTLNWNWSERARESGDVR